MKVLTKVKEASYIYLGLIISVPDMTIDDARP